MSVWFGKLNEGVLQRQNFRIYSEPKHTSTKIRDKQSKYRPDNLESVEAEFPEDAFENIMVDANSTKTMAMLVREPSYINVSYLCE